MGIAYTLTPIDLATAEALIAIDDPAQGGEIGFLPDTSRVWRFGGHDRFSRMAFFAWCERGPEGTVRLPEAAPGLHAGMDLGHYDIHLLMPVHVAMLSDRFEALSRATIRVCLESPGMAEERGYHGFWGATGSEWMYYAAEIDAFRLFLREVRARNEAIAITAG